MKLFDRHQHWENIYKAKKPAEVSWYQPTPATSLAFLKEFNVPLTARIIDIGGGDSLLVDHLVHLGYKDITVLDISETAIKRAKHRLGDNGRQVKWVVADATTFQPIEKYDFWHDRAAFHFLTSDHEIENYIATVQQNLRANGILLIGTFSENGPKKCSGMDIKQYTEKSMTDILQKFFTKIKCITVDHTTPVGAIQNFIFCSFKKMQFN